MSKNLDEIRAHTLHSTFIRTSKAHMHLASTFFKEIGLSKGQPKILDFLAYNDGCPQKDLASHCRIEPATVTSLLTAMEKSELIYRLQNEQDKRVWNVYLTETGKTLQKQVESIFSTLDDICFTGFTDSEKALFIQLLSRCTQNLEGRKISHD